MANPSIISRIKDYFSSFPEDAVSYYRAPGRINLIGEHLDYNDGFVMPAAIDKAMYFGIAKRDQEHSLIHSLDYGNEVELKPGLTEMPGWAKYFEALFTQLSKRGYDSQTVTCVFSADLPIGAGLSSSAALCCGFLTALSEMHDWHIPKKEIALIGQAAEHQVGIKCGIMDQYAVTFGKKIKSFCWIVMKSHTNIFLLTWAISNWY